MLSVDLLLFICLAYVVLLFAVAFLVDRRARQGLMPWLRSPLIYTLSISVYCTSWTFYGAVGSAARNGLEFVTIYLGPTLVFIGWWWLLRKLVRIGRVLRAKDSVIQTDCPLVGGDSGGPLFDLEGRVIGINSAAAFSFIVHEPSGIMLVVSDRSRLASRCI